MYCNIIIRNAMFTNTYVSFQDDFASLAKDVKIRQKSQTNILASQKVVIPPDRYFRPNVSKFLYIGTLTQLMIC